MAYIVGDPFSYEMDFNPMENWNDTISIKGTVVYYDGEFAIVKISSRSIEFEGFAHYYDETHEYFPDFEDNQADNLDEYLWINTAIEGFGGFILNESFSRDENEADSGE